MSTIFSKACEYAIQSTLYIGLHGDRRVGIKEIARQLDIPVHFLAKILQSLAERGVLTSFKGTAGGYTLGSPAESIRLLDIVSAVDGLELFEHCVLGFPHCSSEHPCPVHDTWKGVLATMRDMLSQESLADLMPVTETKIKHTVRSVRRKLLALQT
jgi:Rrf2 family transcriptional regulator, iron-sulfur cluster assembly transcription factor